MAADSVVIRPAVPDDAETIFKLILALAEYEQLAHEVVGSVDALTAHLFGDRPVAEVLIADANQHSVGFALFFTSYSTFLTKPGIYLEDLFVLPGYRGLGIGKSLLCHLAKLALERDCGRLEWSVLDWNEPAIGFYERMGATVLPDWRICRVTGEHLLHLAALPVQTAEPFDTV